MIKTQKKFKFTPKQEAIFKLAVKPETKMVAIDGLYGTGKTWLAWYTALNLMNTGEYEKIMYLRNPVESTKHGKMGFLPGEAADKMAPYMAPAQEKIHEIVKEGRDRIPVEFQSLGYIRGTNWSKKIVIIDEAASLSKDDLVLITTRAAEDTLIILIGDSANQSDIGRDSGFQEFMNLFDDTESADNGIVIGRFNEESDIVRSQFVKFVLKKFGKLKKDNFFDKKYNK